MARNAESRNLLRLQLSGLGWQLEKSLFSKLSSCYGLLMMFGIESLCLMCILLLEGCIIYVCLLFALVFLVIISKFYALLYFITTINTVYFSFS